MTVTMHEVRLRRTGDVPVVFDGVLVGERTTRRPPTPGRKGVDYLAHRWHELRLYRSARGRLILGVRFASTWPDDAHLSRDDVLHGRDLDALRDRVLEYQPVPPGVGFTRDTPTHDRKQEQMVETLTTAFDKAVASLYLLLPGAEATEDDLDREAGEPDE